MLMVDYTAYTYQNTCFSESSYFKRSPDANLKQNETVLSLLFFLNKTTYDETPVEREQVNFILFVCAWY